MLDTIFATKQGMTQAWLKSGKRVAVTKCLVQPNRILGRKSATIKPNRSEVTLVDAVIYEVGYGDKKLKNMKKPLRERLTKGGFSVGVKQISGVRTVGVPVEQEMRVGQTVTVDQVLSVGDVVKVQGLSKGRGFAGVVKRYGFAGGPATHGQSDRERAVGSIGAGTTPGHVFRGKRMPGHYGDEAVTVSGLTVLHIDPATNEIWLSGPVPGSVTSTMRITKVGTQKTLELDHAASGIEVVKESEAVVATEEAAQVAAPEEETKVETQEVTA